MKYPLKGKYKNLMVCYILPQVKFSLLFICVNYYKPEKTTCVHVVFPYESRVLSVYLMPFNAILCVC